ncbi:MAG: radical SAM protein [Planctomycetota bacterium]
MNNEKDILYISEIFYSIQGESTYQGEPCIFIRLAGCNLKCKWCDTTYAFTQGYKITFDQVIEEIKRYKTKLVEITGGEPLLQKAVIPFMRKLLHDNYKLLLETSGAISIKDVPRDVIIIMDIKCPGSGESDKNLWENLGYLKNNDEIKFVIADKNDYEWAKEVVKSYKLNEKHKVLFSPVFESNIARDLAEWILNDFINVRFNLQIHKVLWANKRGR